MADVISITLLTLQVSGSSTLLASLIGIPLGARLGLQRSKRRLPFLVFTHAFYGMPPVIMGLVVYLLLSKAGPLGDLGLLFTPVAMVIAQTSLLLPIVVGFTASAVASVPPEAAETARALGAGEREAVRAVLREARPQLAHAVLVAFGRAVSEVGAVIIVGGNIADRTRVLTTAIVLETEAGNFQFALTLGGILLALALAVSALMTRFQEDAHEVGGLLRRGRREGRG
ncbi:MAG: ABC transporter permease [Halobacteria archaeon]